MPTLLLADLLRDVALAGRHLIRRPTFALAAGLTLMLGLGAPTAVFAVVHAVLLRPLPFPDAERLVRFRLEFDSPRGRGGFDALPVDFALDWAAGSRQLTGLALFNDAARTLATPDGPVRLTGIAASPSLFDILGTPPLVGRTFSTSDADPAVIVLSHATWQRYFGADPAVAGRQVTLDGRAHRVLGVMPPRFDFPSAETAFWMPVRLEAGSRGMVLPALGRLAPGASPAGAAGEARTRLGETAPDGGAQAVMVRPLREQMVGGVSRMLWILMAAVTLVSLVATVNISLLLLTRGAGREREFAIRAALGAGRGRLVRQLCAEGAVLAIAGGAAGFGFARVAMGLLVRIAPPEIPRLQDTTMDAAVLAFGGALVLGAGMLFGVLGAGRAFAAERVRANGAPAAPRRRLQALAAAELALAMVLLAAAGVLLRSFVGLALVDQGFDTTDRLAFRVTLPSARYPGPAARLAFDEALLERLRSIADVDAVGLITALPNRQPSGRFAYDPAGMPDVSDPFSLQLAEVRMATAGFFDAMGIPLRRGRTFGPEDVAGADPVIVISESLARTHFGEQDPVGRLLYSESGTRRVIGVVGDVRSADPDALQHDPSAYLPLAQAPNVLSFAATANVLVRARNVSSRVPDLRAAIRGLDPDLPMFDVRTLDQLAGALVAGPRFVATVLGLFAAVAVVMAAVGVYGVMAFGVALRTREMGVRLALGASASQVRWLVLREGAAVVGLGLAAGIGGAWASARSLTGLVHEVAPADPAALATVASILLVTGLAACAIPARRAGRADVLTVLRED